MAARRDRVVLWASALLVAAWMAAELLASSGAGLLHVAPALALALALLVGRYPGEKRLARLAGGTRARAARVRSRVATPRSYVRVMLRGGRLVASAMAKRPPPASGRLSTA